MMTKNNPISFGNLEKNRAHEIDLFLKDFNFVNYVIVDDLNVGLYLSSKNEKFVLTKDAQGLKQNNIKNKILKILSNESN
jgi:hypothetical protein